MEAEDERWALLLRHLGNTGPSLAEDVQRELQLTPKELKAIRSPLERCGAVVGRLVPVPGKEDDSVTELVRWDHLHPDESARRAASTSSSSRASAPPSSAPSASRGAGSRGPGSGRMG